MGYGGVFQRLVLCLALLGRAATAGAAPLDLRDPNPRWIEVAFEISPAEEPGRLDTHWSAPRRAFIEPDERADHVRIRVPAAEIEAHLGSTGTDVVPGSFGEFVWTLERGAGTSSLPGSAGGSGND